MTPPVSSAIAVRSRSSILLGSNLTFTTSCALQRGRNKTEDRQHLSCPMTTPAGFKKTTQLPTDFLCSRRTFFVPDGLSLLQSTCPLQPCPSLHRHAFRQVARLVHIGAARAGCVVGQQLQRHHVQQG